MALAVRPTLLTFAKSLALSQAASPVTQDALKEEEEQWRTKTTQASEHRLGREKGWVSTVHP